MAFQKQGKQKLYLFILDSMIIYKTDWSNLNWQKENEMGFKYMAISTTDAFSYLYVTKTIH